MQRRHLRRSTRRRVRAWSATTVAVALMVAGLPPARLTVTPSKVNSAPGETEKIAKKLTPPFRVQ